MTSREPYNCKYSLNLKMIINARLVNKKIDLCELGVKFLLGNGEGKGEEKSMEFQDIKFLNTSPQGGTLSCDSQF